MSEHDGDDLGNFRYYTHIMLIGQRTENVVYASSDVGLSPKRRIYLIHSPNQKKASDVPKPLPLKKYAQETKKKIEAGNPATTVILKELGKNGAFNEETISIIKNIVDEEKRMEDWISPKQICINITGGTNMMAACASLAAMFNNTQAYYVKDRNFAQNRELRTLISKIGLAALQNKNELTEEEKEILYQIKNNTFHWDKPEETATADQGSNTITNYTINESIKNSIWSVGQNISEMIEHKKLKSMFPEIPPTTLTNRLKDLEQRGMIIITRGIPTITNPQRRNRYFYREYVISGTTFTKSLIQLTERGRSEINTYDSEEYKSFLASNNET